MPDTASLVAAARLARDRAHAPYSHFKVGAALADMDGRVYLGCNIENATFGLTICAERVAVFHALSEGARRFSAVAVVADAENVAPPCGACRQILWEFCGDVSLILANLAGRQETLSLKELFPRPFDATFL